MFTRIVLCLLTASQIQADEDFLQSLERLKNNKEYVTPEAYNPEAIQQLYDYQDKFLSLSNLMHKMENFGQTLQKIHSGQIDLMDPGTCITHNFKDFLDETYFQCKADNRSEAYGKFNENLLGKVDELNTDLQTCGISLECLITVLEKAEGLLEAADFVKPANLLM